MKIRRVILENHPILGTLELDFCSPEGIVMDTIILAGENGVGKTVLLQTIFEILERRENIMQNESRSILLEISNSDIEAFVSEIFPQKILKVEPTIYQNLIELKIYRDNLSNTKVEFILIDTLGNKAPIDLRSHSHLVHKFILKGCMYSNAEVDYNPNPIQYTASSNIDNVNTYPIKSTSHTTTEIAQLLVDISHADAMDLMHWSEQNTGLNFTQYPNEKRMDRFKRAFNLIFPKKKFYKISDSDNEKKILFREDERIMGIESLSSGEKQIVFRGCFLLRNQKKAYGSVILIDEPEISLHPRWQLEIMNFYKALFRNKENIQTSQIIVATHSPFIIHNPQRNGDKVIILSKGENDVLVSRHPKFFGWHENEIVKEAFKIEFKPLQNSSSLFVEGETDERYLNKTIEVYNLNSKLKFRINWIGRINGAGKVEFTGSSALNSAKNFFLANPDTLNAVNILCYDNDEKQEEEAYPKLLVKKMPKNDLNQLYRRGIENLLILPLNFNQNNFYNEKSKIDEYGAASIIRQLDKSKLCQWICNECSTETQIEILENLKDFLVKTNSEMK